MGGAAWGARFKLVSSGPGGRSLCLFPVGQSVKGPREDPAAGLCENSPRGPCAPAHGCGSQAVAPLRGWTQGPLAPRPCGAGARWPAQWSRIHVPPGPGRLPPPQRATCPPHCTCCPHRPPVSPPRVLLQGRATSTQAACQRLTHARHSWGPEQRSRQRGQEHQARRTPVGPQAPDTAWLQDPGRRSQNSSRCSGS